MEEDGQNGKLAVLDISESGDQICEKLFALLEGKQKQELIQYVLTKKKNSYSDVSLHDNTPSIPQLDVSSRLTEVQADGLYFCLENRLVYVCETEILLTVKEFDIFALLIMNPHRILTYDMIMDIVWHETLDFYSRRAINNHVSNLRKKLRITPEIPDYIRSVRDIGYKFNPNIKIF